MDFDFSTLLDRRGKDAIAIDFINLPAPWPMPDSEISPNFDPIPMWIADMSFRTVHTVTDAIRQRLEHPIFGYFMPSQAYYDAIIFWQKTMFGVSELRMEHLGHENSVLGGVSAALQILCSQGDPVLVNAPAYNGFLTLLEKNGYKNVLSPLALDEKNIWRMNFEDMERKIKENQIHTAIFCSPHNPTGRVWEKWEIEQAMEIFKRNDVFVISDEIWSDITLYGHQHVPTQSVSDDAKNRTIALYAPTKTFNLAGLTIAYHVVYNQYLSERLKRYETLSYYNMMNVLSMHALIGAYQNEGKMWLDELKKVLEKNITTAYDFFKDAGVALSMPQGTYMLFIDCEQWCKEHRVPFDELQKAGVKVGVLWRDGAVFNAPNTIRMNLALPHERMLEALERLKKYVF